MVQSMRLRESAQMIDGSAVPDLNVRGLEHEYH
jgi:hypothetical protein